MPQKHLQRLAIFLKSGQNISIDFNVPEQNKLNRQIEMFVKALGQPEEQQKVIVFEGQRFVGVRIAEVAAYEVLPLVLTPKAESQNSESEPAAQ